MRVLYIPTATEYDWIDDNRFDDPIYENFHIAMNEATGCAAFSIHGSLTPPPPVFSTINYGKAFEFIEVGVLG